MVSVKESLKRVFDWAEFFYTNQDNWYHSLEHSFIFEHIVILQKTPSPKITPEPETSLMDRVITYARAFWQQIVGQETTMSKMGTLPHYQHTKNVEQDAKIRRPLNLHHQQSPKIVVKQVNAIIPFVTHLLMNTG